MNRIFKKLLLGALLAGGIIASNVNAIEITENTDESVKAAQTAQDERDLRIANQAFSPEADATRAERAAKKIAAEADDIDYSTGNLYEEDTTTPASTSVAVEKSAKTKKRRKSARGKKGKKSKKAHSKSTRKGKKGSKFEKRRIARKKSVRKAKAPRKSKTARPHRQPKGVAQKADKGRIKSWKSRHKKTQASRKKRLSKKAPKTPAQRATMVRKHAEKMLAKQPWTLKQHAHAKKLRARLTKLLPQPYTKQDTELMERLDSSIDARAITVE